MTLISAAKKTTRTNLAPPAILTVAGRGTRMDGITSFGGGIPYGIMHKSCIPVANRPNICRIIDSQIGIGTTEFHITSHHMAGDIARVLGHGSRFKEGIKIHHWVETEPTNTALAVNLLTDMKFFPETPFWVIAGDVSFPKIDFKDMMIKFFDAKKTNKNLVGAICFVLRPMNEALFRFTSAVIDENYSMVSFEDPPGSTVEAQEIYSKISNPEIKELSGDLRQVLLPINTAIYFLTKDLFKQVKPPRYNPAEQFDFGKYLFKEIKAGRIFCYIAKEPIIKTEEGPQIKKYFTDLGYPEDIWKANWQFIHASRRSITGKYVPALRSWIGNHVIRKGKVESSVIGDNVAIGENCRVTNSIIGYGVKLEEVEVDSSIIFPYAYVNAIKGSGNVDEIKYSIVVAKITGGSFIDLTSINSNKISNQLAVPTLDDEIKCSMLDLSEEELKLPQKVMLDNF